MQDKYRKYHTIHERLFVWLYVWFTQCLIWLHVLNLCRPGETITVSSHERKGVWNQLFFQAYSRENIKASQHWPFVRGIHWWQVVSPHTWSIKRKAFPYHAVVMFDGRVQNKCNWRAWGFIFVAKTHHFVGYLAPRQFWMQWWAWLQQTTMNELKSVKYSMWDI